MAFSLWACYPRGVMINIQNLSKSYGGQILFENVNMQMNSGERLGLIGRNGYGKSTLLKLILKEEEPDEGQVTYPKNYKIGHLAQHIRFTQPTVLEEACLGLPPGEEYASYKAEAILFGLGFSKEHMDQSPAHFSGGFQIRINLAKLLVSEPDLLLLDEPTNYLDIISIRWIEQFLKTWPNELLVISHDRDFMDSVTTHTAIIHRYKVRKQAGGTEAILNQIAQDEVLYEKTRQNEDKQRKQIESFISRFQARAATAARAQSRIKLLEKMPERDKLAAIQSLDFSFEYAPFEAKTILTAESLSFGYSADKPILSDFSLRVNAGDKVAIIGQNGRGKSTLLNVLAGELTPQEGTIKCHQHAKMGFFGQTNINRLNERHTIEEEIAETNQSLGITDVRSICGTMMFSGDLAQKKISILSGGEKSRVLLGKILATPANLLLLDEPTNHLDMTSIEAMLDSLCYFEGAVVIVTHNEMILRKLATRLVVFSEDGILNYEGTYDEFLSQIGWASETSMTKAKKGSKKSKEDDKKAEKKEAHESSEARAKKIRMLKKEIEKIETQITVHEASLKVNHEEIAWASAASNVDKLITLTQSGKVIQNQIDEAFALLQEKTQELESLESC